MPTDATIVTLGIIATFGVAAIKFIGEWFKTKRPPPNGPDAKEIGRLFRGLYGKLDPMKKLLQELVDVARRRETQIAVDQERHETFAKALERIEKEIEAVRNQRSQS